MDLPTNVFPIDLSAYQPLSLDPAQPELTSTQRKALLANIQLCRDAIVFLRRRVLHGE